MSKSTPYRSVCALVLVLCLAFGAIPAMAQSQASSGQIAGSVIDNAGAAVTGATVKAVNTQTGLERVANTNDDGLFTIVLLPPGVYSVTAEATGFSAVTLERVEVIVGRTADVKLSLGVSGVQEVVNVSAGAVQVQTTRSEADAVLNETAIENLPINGRRFQDFVTLTPGAQVESRRGQISLSGQRGINGNVSVDGADYNNPFFGGIRGGERSNFAPTIPQEAIKEFQVVAAGYSPEFGRSTGGIVNAVTKSGTNAFHGSGFFLARPKELSRDNGFINELEFALRQDADPGPGVGAQINRNLYPAPSQFQFGGSFGGPIIKDKLFFFAAYEQQRVRQNRSVVFDSLSSFVPTATTQEGFDFLKSLEEPFLQTNDSKVLLGRVDYEINNSHRANVRYNFSDLKQLNAVSTGNQLFPTISNSISNNGTEKDRTNTVVGQMASFFTTSLVNELRVQYSREERPRIANSIEPNITSIIGVTGTVNFLGQNEQFDWRLQVADNLSWIRGNHTFKFGGEYNHVYAEQLFGFDQTGTFQILGGTTAGVLDILSFTPGAGSTVNRFDNTSVRFRKQIGNLQSNLTTEEIAFFGQDSWRIRPNFTLTYGLRWEGQFNPTPDTSNTALLNLVKDFRFPSGHTLDPTQIPDDTDQFGPRVGFAWDPFSDQKTVIRGYSGIYYARTPALLLTDALNNYRNPPGNLTVQLPIPVVGNPANTVYKQLLLIGIDLNDFALGALPIITPEQIGQIATALGLDPLTAGAQPQAFARDFNNPKSYQAGLGVEREVARGLSVGADFTYVHTVHLQRNRDLNLPLPILRPLAVDPAQRPFFGLNSGVPRPISSLGQVQVRESTAKALYRAFTLRTKFQRSWGQFNAFYTLSKALSDDDNERSSGGFPFDNAFDLGPEYGYSELDRRHQFTFNPVFFLPGGIDFSSALRFRSGRPVDARVGSDLNQDGVNNDRPYLAPGIPFQRNSFRNRALYDVDVRVQKRFSVGENARLIFSWEVFNLLNLENIELSTSSTVTNFCATTTQADCGFLGPSNPNFLSLRERRPGNIANGRYLSANNPGTPFQMQFGARFQF
ncbi:MAG TPA: carboxypeptidase regulatory-like domain-containing protein [Blastocatellia bacterium]|nr:carboxypeptidase regulatory-like domain-containing protein [Blastocatellia bacterium]